MPNANDLLESCRKRKWAELEKHLEKLSGAEMPDRVEWLVNELRQQGYMVCRRDVAKDIERRNVFQNAFRDFLDKNKMTSIADEWRSDDATINAIEWGYHKILDSVKSLVDDKLPPDRHVWAVIKHLEKMASEARTAVKNSMPSKGQLLDPTAIFVTLPDGTKVQPDDFLTNVANATDATIKMLGIANKWFRDNDGRLILPSAPKHEVTDETVATSVNALGLIWQTLERTDQHLRFFGGTASVTKQDMKTAENNTVETDVLDCCIDGRLSIYDKIAHERRSRMLMQFWHQLNWETAVEKKITSNSPTPLPPDGLVSVEESFADISISHFLCKSVVEHKDEPGGLRIVEWVRGYSALVLFSKNVTGDSPYLLDKNELIKYLTERGLTPDKCESFIDSIIFSRNETDLFDAPIVQDVNGQLYLCSSIASSINPVECVFSRLAKVSDGLSWRGPAFEEVVRKLLTDNKITTHHINRKVNKEILEVDAVAFWEGTLFIFECKNISLSGNSNESVYRFYQEQMHAIKQVKTKRDSLLANPEILTDAFGCELEIKSVIPVVLNAMPFSIGLTTEDVYIYDYSALNRFFEGKNLNAVIPAKIAKDIHILTRHALKSLWSGDRPIAQDLVSQMTAPIQMTQCFEQYDWIKIGLPLGNRAALTTSRTHRVTHGLESELSAMGVDGAQIAGELHEVLDEFSKQIQELRHKIGDGAGDDEPFGDLDSHPTEPQK